MLQDGDIAPDFELSTDAGGTLKLSRLRGKPVVVYFYPKDDTSGCTIEAKDFSRLAAEFRKAGVE
ncbi:MAG TPA: redoxin domain-containing protein, partial [Hyphomicrobiaceae bacterium]|nr:redoxin domain-containing protein [Hyphomicrobiaceae bacterium]